jgi:hypothetical protein
MSRTFERWVAVLSALAALVAVPAEAQDEHLYERVAALRAIGEDAAAASLLELEVGDRTPRLEAELGLAYQGAGRLVAAERHLVEALRAEGDAWVEAHRPGLQLALRLARERLAWVTVESDAAGATIVSVAEESVEVPVGRPLRIASGLARIEVRAPGHRSARRDVQVAPSERAVLRVTLEPLACPTAGMTHVGGETGACCWPGQRAGADGCEGAPRCPEPLVPFGATCRVPDAAAPPDRRLATFRLSLLGGVTNFGEDDTALFRRGAVPQGRSTRIGPRAEVRVGFRLFDLFSIAFTAGGSGQEVARWLDCPVAGACGETMPYAYTIDAGVMLLAHTDPPRHGGNVDFHLGIGARPWSRIFFVTEAQTSELTATVIPAELGMSLFFAREVSLDLIGQAHLWIPWEHCGRDAGGQPFCVGADALHPEFGWSGVAGLTFHAD